MVKIPKKSDEFRSMSVLPYLWELHNGSGSADEIDDDDDDYYRHYTGYSGSSGGSIARINELTVNSVVSNVSKTSKQSRASNICKHFFELRIKIKLIFYIFFHIISSKFGFIF